MSSTIQGRPHTSDVVVTVRPLGRRSSGGANIELAPHLEHVGKQVGEAFQRMVRAMADILPDELKVKLGLKLEGAANWVLVSSKAGASLEVEAVWKKTA